MDGNNLFNLLKEKELSQVSSKLWEEILQPRLYGSGKRVEIKNKRSKKEEQSWGILKKDLLYAHAVFKGIQYFTSLDSKKLGTT